ncbi:hypothetical protein MUP77_18370 [Candidatus Bathyarchaeota archaeon]|nr:hypothetical protein [Candidatus Bathyarchaeota archaeon]
MALVFIYFQIVLSKDAQNVISHSFGQIPFLGIDITPATIAFGFLISILFWQVNGLLLYARMEVYFVYTHDLKEDRKNIERPITRKITAVGLSILEKWYLRILYHFAGFRHVTSIFFTSDPNKDWKYAIVFSVLVISTYIFLIFPVAMRFIMYIIPSNYIAPIDYKIQYFILYSIFVAILLFILLSVHSYGWHKSWKKMRFMIAK